MEFARNQLEKYGWKEGEGLGKKKDGRAAPIRTTLKLNSHGIGYNAGQEYSNNWWERLFNDAAANIQTVEDQDGAVTRVETKGEVIISTKKKRKGDDLEYGAFKKKSSLNGLKVEETIDSDSSSEEELGAVSDERLFEICGGRTGHKGSRHGLTLSGKLARLEQQEKVLADSGIPEGKQLLADEVGKSKNKTNADSKEKMNAKKKKKKRRNTDTSKDSNE